MSEWVESDGTRPTHLRNADLVERERHHGGKTISTVGQSYWPNTKRWRLVTERKENTTMTNSFIQKFKAGTVVDRTAFNALSNDKLAIAASELYKEGEPAPIFVQSVADFFSKNNLMKQVADNGEHLAILLEKWEIELAPEQLEVLSKFTSVKTFIVEKVSAIKTPYPFAEVPAGWSIENNIIFKGSTSITRKGCYYSIGIKTLKSVWMKVNKAWLTGTGLPSGYQSINASGYSRQIEYYKDRIVIVCQSIQRYELEQVALHLGWEFPEE